MWEQIRANRRRSAVLISSMVIVLVAMGYTFGEAMQPGAGAIGALAGLGILLIQAAIYFTSPETVLLQGLNAREIQKQDAPQLVNVVEEMVIASGLGQVPRIFIIEDSSPNAFAIGRNPKTGAVAVTSGLLHRLNRDELQGVIAHEIGHLKNRDVQFMTLAAVMLGTIVLLSEMFWRVLRYGGRSSSRSSSRGGSGGQAQAVILIIALVFAILGPLLAQLLYFACSRKREYMADAAAAVYTRYPEGIASALEKIAGAALPMDHSNRALVPMFIVNPLAASSGVVGLFSTHPPTEERVSILRAMGGGAGFANYEQAYKLVMGGGALIGARTLAADQPAPVRAPSGEGPIETRRETRNLMHQLHGYIPVPCTCGMTTRLPQSYSGSQVNCMRCGTLLNLPTPAERAKGRTGEPAPAPAERQMTYRRKSPGTWETFRCVCGHSIQLSPQFTGLQMRCPKCRCDIRFQ